MKIIISPDSPGSSYLLSDKEGCQELSRLLCLYPYSRKKGRTFTELACLKDDSSLVMTWSSTTKQVFSLIMEIPSVAYFSSKENAEDLIGQQEHELVKRCQNGDSQAMEQIVYKYQDQVYNIAYGLLGNTEDARDMTQDAFMRVWEKASQFRFESRFSTWLYRIVTNLCRNEARRRGRRALPIEMDDSEALIPTESGTPEKALLLKEQQEILHTALTRLKAKQREILILREMENLSYEEIAEILGCSIGRVRSRLHESRMQLRKILKHRKDEG